MLYILLQYLHWPELNIRKLGCHHRKEQKSSEKHPALHIKILLFQRWLWSFTVHVYFWAILFILKQFYYTDSSVYIYIYRQLEMKLSNSVIMPSINSPQFVIYLASQILKAYVQSIYCFLTSFACFVHRVQNLVCFLINMHRSWGPLSAYWGHWDLLIGHFLHARALVAVTGSLWWCFVVSFDQGIHCMHRCDCKNQQITFIMLIHETMKQVQAKLSANSNYPLFQSPRMNLILKH